MKIYKFFLATLEKNSFFFNELLKKIHKQEKPLFCKLLISLDYPYTLDYK